MSIEARLCREIIKEEFGPFASEVAEQLLLKGRQTLQELARHTQYTVKRVKEILIIFICHGLLYFTESIEERKDATVYELDQRNVLMRLRMGRILRITEEHYGKVGSSICQLLFLYGRVKLSQVKEWAVSNDTKHKDETAYVKTFTRMAIDQFITAVLPIHSRSSLDMTRDIEEELSKKYTIMTAADKKVIKLAAQAQAEAVFEHERIGMKRKLDITTTESETKRLAQENDLPYDIDPTVFFALNYEKYNIAFRNNMITDFATDRINRTAGIVLKAFLRNGKDKMKMVKEETSAASTPNHIANMLHPEVLERGDIILPRDPSNPKKKPTVSETIEGYVKLLKTDTAGFLTTKDQLGPNHYAVNFEKLRYNMKKRLFENSITERYGRAVCRIVRILLDKDGIVEIQEVPRSTDRATSRSFHLWHVPLEKCFEDLLTKAYKIIVNLQQRKVEELQQRSRLLEKMNRKDVIANMDLLNEIDKAEVGNMNKIIERIEVSKARLDEMAMILRDF
ncbi:hypothetical protein G6F57_002648 [Rhizopus arrhizus]|uniref:DNA-directed RNA polymerase III subunit RPC3 n=1 Tax=Rhizopus oryzae TaxID=64495 RepID=A0A9P7BWZ2_RHIOR|nr:hypothetical protein G6F23_001644 [Rhizopus arrhizus]KAG1419164.1 hypothetical protein G6F58_004746 [Rhizopus delemar]KAG0768846.1 hypothetical protein G6F24_001574 [Rhizopus arrhizus]KAG0795533.1 hypothetical protein G6F21_002023 [Rhizopus arrhizus]KAG0800723.1 hypothetical protein G6F22_001949 [Rhizopus arrhizus]